MLIFNQFSNTCIIRTIRHAILNEEHKGNYINLPNWNSISLNFAICYFLGFKLESFNLYDFVSDMLSFLGKAQNVLKLNVTICPEITFLLQLSSPKENSLIFDTTFSIQHLSCVSKWRSDHPPPHFFGF